MTADLVPAGLGGRLVLAAADYRRNRGSWLDARRAGLGASDTAAILGLNKYRTALDVYLDKTADAAAVDAEVSEAAAWGHLLEPVVARRTVRQHPGLGKLVSTPGLLAHPEYPWMLATIDYGLAARGSRSAPVRELLEVKTTSVAAYRANWLDGVPPAGVLVQCQQQMAVTGLDVAWVTCAVGGDSGPMKLAEPYRVERSPAVIDQLIAYGGAWWADYVEARRRPEPTFSDADKLGWLYPADDSAGALPLTADLEATIADLLDARRRAREAKEAEMVAAFGLKLALAGGQTAIADPAGSVLLTWKNKRQRIVDAEAMAAARPDLVADYAELVAEFTRVETVRGSLLVKNQEERI